MMMYKPTGNSLINVPFDDEAKVIPDTDVIAICVAPEASMWICPLLIDMWGTEGEAEMILDVAFSSSTSVIFPVLMEYCHDAAVL